MTAENKDFFEALSMLEHERGITAEYLIEKIKAAIIIAVKKNYEVEEDHIRGARISNSEAAAVCLSEPPIRREKKPMVTCPFINIAQPKSIECAH